MEHTKESLIFVQIPAYRDPEVVPTIKDLISKSAFPHNLRFGICNQYHEDDKWSLDEWRDDDRFTIMDVPWNESKGLCWARGEIQKMWQGEGYTLQIDSHHRFLDNWDVHLIKMMEQVDSEKPIITSYAGMYEPKENKLLNEDPFKMVGKQFTSGGTILFYPEAIENYKELEKPIKGRFVSGHFYFTLGKHCQEYKYDPNLYFAGDEISLSIRSWTLGYDIYHPHYVVVWHEYTREGREKHWGNHTTENLDVIDMTWSDRNDISLKRLRQMLQEEDNGTDIGEYGLGSVRSHREYENYAGIDFANRVLHEDTIKGVEPPCITDDNNNGWRTQKQKLYNITIDWTEHWDKIKSQTSCTCKFDFIYLGIKDQNNKEIFRFDLTNQQQLDGDILNQPISFMSYTEPVSCVLWPHEKDGDWLTNIQFNI